MNREIKFRAWDIENKRFVNIVRLIFDQFGALDYAEVVFKGKIYKLYPSEIVLEQDTGLKDKNGKRIRDGDIVKVTKWVHDENLGHEEFSHIAKISWWGRYAQFGTDYSDNLSDEITEDFFEVIGNIHENPELL